MKIAFMFPGQGAQVVGMGKDFYDKEVFKKKEPVLVGENETEEKDEAADNHHDDAKNSDEEDSGEVEFIDL